MSRGIAGAALARARRTTGARVSVAVLAVGVATALKLAAPEVGRAIPVSLYLGAVMLAAWFGGTRPGLLATALSTVAGLYFFVAPYHSFEVAGRMDALRLGLGLVQGIVISLLAGALHAARDAAERRAEELARANDALRQAIDARARAESSLRETTAQLVHSQKMQTLGVFAGGLAHDFNNLLAVISSYASLVHSRLGAHDPLRDDVREIQGATERAATLTRRLLAFARKTAVEPRAVDVNGTVRELEGILRVLLGDGVTLAITTEHAPAPVVVDPGQLEQIVTNLAVNARDAMPQGGHLAVEVTSVRVAGTDHVRLRVADTGGGMDPDVVARIFEPSFTTKEAGRGSGLGLAIVSDVVGRAGGTITVESAPGNGTTFTVHLPRASGDAVAKVVFGADGARAVSGPAEWPPR